MSPHMRDLVSLTIHQATIVLLLLIGVRMAWILLPSRLKNTVVQPVSAWGRRPRLRSGSTHSWHLSESALAHPADRHAPLSGVRDLAGRAVQRVWNRLRMLDAWFFQHWMSLLAAAGMCAFVLGAAGESRAHQLAVLVDPNPAFGLVPVMFGDLQWGYINTQGQVVIPPRFSRARPFQGGLAAARSGEHWGFIDRTGRWVIEPQFERCEDFSEGLAVVAKQGKWGFINPLGHLAVPCIYEDAQSFSEGLAAVRVDRLWGFIDQRGRMRIPPQFTFAEDFTGGLAKVYYQASVFHYYIDREGTCIWAQVSAYRGESPSWPPPGGYDLNVIERYPPDFIESGHQVRAPEPGT
jgi:hypothetical protein